jgi:hypothetical protein
MPLKVGDLVYAAREWCGEVTVEAAKVTGIGKKSVRISGVDGRRTSLHFGCRAMIDPDSVLLAPTKVEALERYARSLYQQIVEDRRAIHDADKTLEIVKSMIYEEKKSCP